MKLGIADHGATCDTWGDDVRSQAYILASERALDDSSARDESEEEESPKPRRRGKRAHNPHASV